MNAHTRFVEPAAAGARELGHSLFGQNRMIERSIGYTLMEIT